MAITYIDFVPSLIQAPEFQVTLDQQFYNVIVTWNLFGQRYYINIYTLDGTLVVCKALIGSPIGVQIASATWSSGKVTLITQKPHGLALNATVNVTISGVTPDGYNGQVKAFITGRNSLTFALASNPGEIVITGSVNQNIDLVAGYFLASTMVFRQANNQFEIAS